MEIRRLLVIKPSGLNQLAPFVICCDMKEEPDVSKAVALRGFDEQEYTFDLQRNV